MSCIVRMQYPLGHISIVCYLRHVDHTGRWVNAFNARNRKLTAFSWPINYRPWYDIQLVLDISYVSSVPNKTGLFISDTIHHVERRFGYYLLVRYAAITYQYHL